MEAIEYYKLYLNIFSYFKQLFYRNVFNKNKINSKTIGVSKQEIIANGGQCIEILVP